MSKHKHRKPRKPKTHVYDGFESHPMRRHWEATEMIPNQAERLTVLRTITKTGLPTDQAKAVMAASQEIWRRANFLASVGKIGGNDGA